MKRSCKEIVIKQPSTESLSPKQSIEFQQDGGEFVIDQRRVLAVVPYQASRGRKSLSCVCQAKSA
jgi:hypothetical protein